MRLTGRAGAIAPELKGDVMGFKVFLAAAAIAGVASPAQGAIVDLRVEDRAGSLPGL